MPKSKHRRRPAKAKPFKRERPFCIVVYDPPEGENPVDVWLSRISDESASGRVDRETVAVARSIASFAREGRIPVSVVRTGRTNESDQ